MIRSKNAVAALFIAAIATVPAACASTSAGAAAADYSAVTSETPALITEADVIAAQNAWGSALVSISRTYDEKGIDAATQLAGEVLDSAYGYQMGPVLFKPTLTVAPQTFRTTREGALAYFVGGNANYPNDAGFALNGWDSYEIKNAGIFIDGDTAISMGNVMLTNKAGNVTTVDKTWGYLRDENGTLRIILHHSSLPYTAQ
ncbi:MAG TPA: phosphoribosyl-AMP cyclohydrolase [Hyphomonas sp.]|nr:phosphoribosyl-AMP cyclohydrolase [Hyphomonas sp.]HRJ02220.1 phosphoribosyl-AMP cyclohydrolase [Hyphomonas sp.]HRK66448.1 phosphoribosyl-AMP cyclohydrolase [Hyphomonas sp.]